MKLLAPEPRIVIAATIIFLVFSTVSGQRRTVPKTAEQITFSSESEIKNAVTIPRNVLEQLAEFEGGRLKQCQNDEFSRQANIGKHFAAAKINLNRDSQQDLIVQAQTSCFMGAHNTTFWVFTDVGQRLSPGYDLVFSVASDFLEILKTSTNGYRDIETASHTAAELYSTTWKFDGSKYQPRNCTIQGLTSKKVTRVKCGD